MKSSNESLKEWFKQFFQEKEKQLSSESSRIENTPELSSVMEELPAVFHNLVFRLLEGFGADAQGFSPLLDFCMLKKQSCLAAKIDEVCCRRTGNTSMEEGLAKAFKIFFTEYQTELLNTETWKQCPPDIPILILKWCGNRLKSTDLLELLSSTEPELRHWAAYHLSLRDSRKSLQLQAAPSGGQYSNAIRTQVLEVIVRQAIAGAPWQEICAGPMKVNGISSYDVYEAWLKRATKKLDFEIGMENFWIPDEQPLNLSHEKYQQIWPVVFHIARDALKSCIAIESDKPSSSSWKTLEEVEVSKVLLESSRRIMQPLLLGNADATIELWLRQVLSTKTNKEKAEADIKDWYQWWHQAPPSKVIWCQSPAEGFVQACKHLTQMAPEKLAEMERLDAMEAFWAGSPGINIQTRLQNFSLDKAAIAPWRGLRQSLSNWQVEEPETFESKVPQPNRFAPIGGAPRINCITRMDRIAQAIRSQNTRYVEEKGALNNLPEAVQKLIKDLATALTIEGQFASTLLLGAGVCARENLYSKGIVADSPEISECFSPYKLLRSIAQNAGFWWAFSDVLIISEKPTEVNIDEDIRLHNESGPALSYSDGFSLYYIEGIEVPAVVVLDPQNIEVSAIEAEPNVEIRRIMMRRYGLDRFMQNSGAEIVHNNENGTLYRKEMSNDEALVMVKVINSTAEPDGSFKEYFLRVPPEMQTVDQAVAWTFNMSEPEYNPTVQT